MKKIKPFLYGIYILFFITAAFIAITHENLVLHWKWDFIDTWVGLMRLVLKLGGIGTVLFASLLILEYTQVRKLRKKIEEQEYEIQKLKSKNQP
ncbi:MULTISPECIES: hypothetical protein [Reichenbachiella]|uniref:Lipopolysaccharide assembly protein A domain-containing protein n=1 Tax=Reichenbachiella agariperforans TaxID=156994 RepID=A0A1M6P389_REIAG|nr:MULTISPECIES: hypothetical protein [Reichenbachiella]MBU2914689.1 hypothetical protein [Reichenbachiella agariperforans]RJE71612.1 hypothetical protein BGP76_05845 [Reichenbachiella sp. MSK19-1]SHK02380.1 hypothetical protein SAMN04488028_102528 [Reichenbachiella agariperforans]